MSHHDICLHWPVLSRSFSKTHTLVHLDSDTLNEKKAETAQISAEFKRVNDEYNVMKNKLRSLMEEAKKIAPEDEWQERLAQDDMPTTLEDVESEMDEAELKVSRSFVLPRRC